jgi:hypothetical protein
MKITLALQLLQNMGSRYVLYRVRHELEKRFGILKKKHPINPSLKSFITLDAWRENTPSFVITERESLTFPKEKITSLKDKFEKISNGEICFFSYDWKNLGLDYDWVTNPDSGYRYDISKHWSEISDLNPSNGDIKYVWEKSRFSYLLTIIRYDYHFEEDHAEFVFSEIESWIAANPINQGPNWRCSQEISLRIFNWCYALTFYKNSDALTEKRWVKIQHVIYWSLHHVYHHINFSRIAVRNNHAITETLVLSLSELLFPFIPETKKWANKGRAWFEKEIAYQIYEDGTFLQFSMNYHRVVIQLLSLGISLTEKHHVPFSSTVYYRSYKSLDFLYQCLQEENGFLPNYGANDGAWFFPLSETLYRDYRPQLNTLHLILTKKSLYSIFEIEEDAFWLFPDKKIGSKNPKALVTKKYGAITYDVGGYFILRSKDSFSFIRCGKYKDRPSHADNLHLDIWINGENVLRDSGTYKYNTDKENSDYFTGSKGHNTVMLGNQSQMLKGSRFIWFYWSQGLFGKWEETEKSYVFSGAISAFRFINPKIVHSRKVTVSKIQKEWIIDDTVEHGDGFIKKQIWHVDDFDWEFKGLADSKITVEGETITSFNSSFYGQKVNGKAIAFPFDNKIKTILKYK